MFKDIYRKWFPKTSFPYRFKNILNIPKFIKEIFSFLKKGYPYNAVYGHYNWFIDTELRILKEYNKIKVGYPCDMTMEEWNSVLEKMIGLLEIMNNNYTLTTEDLIVRNNKRNEAKEEFFELYSKYFWNLWD